MTKHLVSTLRKSEQIAFKNELRLRLRIGTTLLGEFAEDEGIDKEAISPQIVANVLDACFRGVGFAAEEVRGMRAHAIRVTHHGDDADE